MTKMGMNIQSMIMLMNIFCDNPLEDEDYGDVHGEGFNTIKKDEKNIDPFRNLLLCKQKHTQKQDYGDVHGEGSNTIKEDERNIDAFRNLHFSANKSTPEWPGNFGGTKYRIGDRIERRCNATNTSIIYYEGLIKRESEATEEVTFLRVKNHEEGERVIRLSNAVSQQRGGDAALFKPKFLVCDYTKHRSKKIYLVCFEALEVFDDENSLRIRLSQQPGGTTVLGCPYQVGDTIKSLSKTMNAMIQVDVSSSLLGSPLALAWSKCTKSVKFLKLDINMEEKKKEDEDEKNNPFNHEIKHFHVSIRDYIFDPANHDFPLRDEFLECFLWTDVPVDRRMRLIRKHPFLKKRSIEILAYFANINQAVMENNFFDGRSMVHYTSKISMYKGQIFGYDKDRNMRTTWYSSIWGPKFEKFIRHSQTFYEPTSMLALLTCVRNMYNHPEDVRVKEQESDAMSLDDILLNIVRVWPNFLGTYHGTLYA